MKQIILISIGLFIGVAAMGQNYWPGMYNKFGQTKKYPLIVVTAEMPDDVQKDLEKSPEYLDYYKRKLNQYNEDLKDAVSKYWKLSDVEYKTLGDFAFIDNDGKNYAVLYLRSYFQPLTLSKKAFYTYGVVATKGSLKDSTSVNFWNGIHSTTELVIDSLNDKTPQSRYMIQSYHFTMEQVFPSKLDLVNAVYAMNKIFSPDKSNEYKGIIWTHLHGDATLTSKRQQVIDKIAISHDKLKNRTLLLRKEWLDPKLTDAVIKQVYPYPYKIVSLQEIESHLGDSAYAYVYREILHGPYLFYSIRDAANHDFMSPPAYGKDLLNKETLELLAKNEVNDN